MGRRDSKNDRGVRRPRGEVDRALDAVAAILRDPALPQALARARGAQGRRKTAALREGALDRLIAASVALDRARPAGEGSRKAASALAPLERLTALADRVRACDGSRAGVRALMRELSDRDSGYNAADIATIVFEVTGARRRTKREALAAIEAWLKR